MFTAWVRSRAELVLACPHPVLTLFQPSAVPVAALFHFDQVPVATGMSQPLQPPVLCTYSFLELQLQFLSVVLF